MVIFNSSEQVIGSLNDTKYNFETVELVLPCDVYCMMAIPPIPLFLLWTHWTCWTLSDMRLQQAPTVPSNPN
jgi:hypothetical protein